MSYRIVFTNRALRDLKGINEENKKTIVSKLKEFLINPYLHLKKLTNPKIGSYRFRIGNYRIIFDIDGDNIVILRVGDRKSIYK
ncbi:MAG: type II toxin-antitoxin system RelE/ParE family toxin [Actinobacteria bacterium]|nr:type II toxin-antitoxin system RelE/ParE family toxin [Actinomycetota bacterium]